MAVRTEPRLAALPRHVTCQAPRLVAEFLAEKPSGAAHSGGSASVHEAFLSALCSHGLDMFLSNT